MWSESTLDYQGGYASALVIDSDGNVTAAGILNEGVVHRYDAEGNWVFNEEVPVSINAAIAGPDGTTLVGTYEGVALIDAQGQMAWEQSLGGYVLDLDRYADGPIVATFGEGMAKAYTDIELGVELWSINTPGGYYTRSEALADGSFLTSGLDGSWTAIVDRYDADGVQLGSEQIEAVDQYHALQTLDVLPTGEIVASWAFYGDQVADAYLGLLSPDASEVLWTKEHVGSEYGYVNAVDVDALGRIAYIWSETPQFGPPFTDWHLVKLDSNGNTIWSTSFLGEIPYDQVTGQQVAFGPDGSVHVVVTTGSYGVMTFMKFEP